MNGYSFPQKVVRFGRFRGTPTKCDPQKRKINENARNKRNVEKKGRMLNGELKYEATGVEKSTKGELAYISLVVFSKGGGVSHDN